MTREQLQLTQKTTRLKDSRKNCINATQKFGVNSDPDTGLFNLAYFVQGFESHSTTFTFHYEKKRSPIKDFKLGRVYV